MRRMLRNELDTLSAVFESTLDAACPSDAVVHIPRLELRLRISDANVLLEQLGFVLAEKLAEQLNGRIAKDATATTVSLPQQRRRDLLQYLRLGQLEWHALNNDAPTTHRLLADELTAWLSEATSSIAVRTALPGSPEAGLAFCLRLLNLLPEGHAFESAVTALTPTPTALPERSEQQKLLDRIVGQMPLAHDGYRRRYLEALYLYILSIDGKIDYRALADTVTPALGATLVRQLEIEVLGKPAPASTPLRTNRSDMEGHARRDMEPRARPASAEETVGDRDDAENVPRSSPTVFASLQPPAEAEAPGLRVHAAGLILLHPYLPRFFEASRIEQDSSGRIVASSLPRAAALLHRLATDREDIQEFELGLIKPLLGLPVDAPLPVAAGLLDATDAEECKALLEAVVSHWSALRSTSADGLRVSFLQRQGLLHDSGRHWQLHIESEAFDILLAQLPWSISLIKLPWMTKPIFTDWPTR